ncbi:MAG: hypothetical protein CM15mP85_26190 [Rhodobacterales bacterium]|nr:MAG: hypothetical protein CM15mP85_26190 [Rhodobacterales bacterium]
MYVSVQNEVFDFSKEIEQFSKKLNNVGALVTFTGIVRGKKIRNSRFYVHRTLSRDD